MDPFAEIINSVLLADGDDSDAVALVPDSAASTDTAHVSRFVPDSLPLSSLDAVPAAGGNSFNASTIEKELTQLCLNESAAPELFHYDEDTINRAKKALKIGRRELSKRKAANDDDGAPTRDTELTAACAIIETERARLKYLLAWYHRLRLEKIERVLDILAQERDAAAAKAVDGDDSESTEGKLSDKLAPAELLFAHGLFDMRLEYMNRVFGSMLPDKYAVRGEDVCSHTDDCKRTLKDLRDEWDHSSVFITADEDIGSVETGSITSLVLHKDDSKIVPWELAKNLVGDNHQAHLI